ncbi:hypothetical protein CEXT_388861 [Caerostris extrusa]|uniref:Uncharacterized protein n=1 Tax=Caerostris extrusa TaxID=172846 RepID=A0AAV4Q2Y4_CAEEX|nr:hypothetical protein CEXT_388861 [Caerostris extrusa]
MFTIQFRKNNLPEDLWVMPEKKILISSQRNTDASPVFTIERNLRTASELRLKNYLSSLSGLEPSIFNFSKALRYVSGYSATNEVLAMLNRYLLIN